MYGKGKHGCPRGFEWSESKKECIPERLGVEDKLKKENERYFFKEENTMDNVNKLVDEVFDGGFSQFGKVRSSEKQIDLILDKVDLGKGTINTTGRPYDHPIKARVEPTIDVEDNIDECVGPMMDGENFEGSEYDSGPSKNDDPKKISNDINHVPNQNVGGLLKSIHGEISEAQIWKMIAEMRINEDYKAYFSSMLKKHGYKSPADIPADKKKEFFNAVDAGWKGKKEKD